MWKKTLSGLLMIGLIFSGSIFGALINTSEPTNSLMESKELADGCSECGRRAEPTYQNNSCNTCSKPRTSCNTCDEPRNTCAKPHNSCDPCDDCCGGTIFGYVDFLYWRLQQGSLAYVIENHNNSSILDGHCCCIEPEYDYGFRVGLGYRTCDCWDIALQYTYWQTDDHASCTDQYGQMLVTRAHPDACENAYYARSNYEIEMHIADLTIGTCFKPCGDVTLRPFFGARVALIDQDLHTVYADEVNPLVATRTDTIVEEVDMISYGVIAGMDMTVPMFCGFGLFGHFGASGMYADFDVSYDSVCEAYPESGVVYSCDCDRVIGMIELAAGLQWEWCFCDCFTVKVAAGWEVQTWFNMIDFVNFTDGNNDGSLARNNQSFGVEGPFVRLGASF
jgi:hypothetical protein